MVTGPTMAPVTHFESALGVEESARVVSDAGDRFVVGTLADVTPLRALEEHASELSAIFESVFHTSSFAVAVFDEHDRLMMANGRSAPSSASIRNRFWELP
jgi:hypothetical protein